MTAETFLLSMSGPAGARRSPLAHRTQELEAAGGPGLSLRELGLRSFLNLRAQPAEPGLPGAGQVAAVGAWEALWLGPGEWLLTSQESLPPQVPGVLVDVSAGYTGLELHGRHARDVLEKAITLDLHPRSFGIGSCAQTTFARGNVLLWQTAQDGYRLLVRPSFATYFADWLIDAAAEFRA